MATRYMNYLRKHAKLVLAVMGVVCMVTFVVGQYLQDLIFGSTAQRQPENAVVVSWTKGNVRENELQMLRFRHNVVKSFLFGVIQETLSRGGTPVVNGRPIRKTDQFFDIGIPLGDSDEIVVNTMLMAEEARRQGVVVDQEGVKDFLRQLSSSELVEADWRDPAEGLLHDNQHLTVQQILEDLAYELRAQHMRELNEAGLRAIPPGELWDYFNRLNRRA